MILSLLYIFMAIFGLSILIFFHELGHYFMAIHVGMRVETFAIGFGKPIFSWEHKGVKWQIGWLLFGGYVKIAGQDSEKGLAPQDIPDGFFGKSPLDRIKVAIAGPLVNLILAFLLFAVISMTGGRDKNFAEFTHKIGWVDPHSELYALGVRPGDEIESYNYQPYLSSKDHIYAPMTAGDEILVKGNFVDYANHTKKHFSYNVKVYPHPNAIEKGIMTAGVLHSANYILYDKLTGDQENPLPEGSPLQDKGLHYGDRVVWVNGSLVFSTQQLNDLLNDNQVLLTILRGKDTLLLRAPKVLVEELKITPEFKEELMDWQHASNLKNVKLKKLYVLPYDLTNDCVVQADIKFIDEENKHQAFSKETNQTQYLGLMVDDKIIDFEGQSIKTAGELLLKLQTPVVPIIIERDAVSLNKVLNTEADAKFDLAVNLNDINTLAKSLGSSARIEKAGNYVLLNSVTPQLRKNFSMSAEKQAFDAAARLELEKEIEKIEDPERKAKTLSLLTAQENQYLIGLPGIQDLKVIYNPSAFTQFTQVFLEIWHTLEALVTGSLNPKWMSGPIGIIQVVHNNSMLGIKEALYWLGAISLNLGLLNLLPVPVLDGGTIVLSLFEIVTKKRLTPKNLERLILPFAVLLIAFFVFLTYQDLSRLLSGFFR